MSAKMGDLVVSLEANMAKFQSDMGKAAQTTEQAMQKMGAAAEFVKGALAGIGAGLSIAALTQVVRGSIDAADHLRDMSQKAGIAVETLNGLGFAAGQAGGNLESMVAAAGKLNKSIVEAAGGNKDVGEGFAKLGISVRDASGQLKTADLVMADIADQFQKYADGPEKTAIALRIFGKAGADMIPVLNDGGKAMRENTTYAQQYSGMTKELTEAADNFNDTMGKIEIQQKAFGNIMATAVLPILQAVAEEYLNAAENSNKFSVASNVVRTGLEALVVVGSEVAFTFQSVGREIGAWYAQADALGVSMTDMAQGPAGIIKALAKAASEGKSSFSNFSAISDAVTADAEKARKEHDAFIARVLDRTPSMQSASGISGEWEGAPDKPRAPKLRAKGDDPTKAILDSDLKQLESAYAKQRDVASFHEKFMDSLRSSTTVDLETFENFKRASIEEGLAAAVRTYDGEIAALNRYRAAAAKETERVQADAQIKEKTDLKEQARIKAKNDLQILDLGNAKVRHDLVKKWQDESDAIDAHHEADFISLHKSLMTVAETENQAYADRIEASMRFRDLQTANVEMANADIERENQRHALAMAQIQASGNLEVLSLVGNSGDQLYNALRDAGLQQTALGKTLFLANKAIAVAEIIVNTELAASKALALGPLIGPPLATAIHVLGYASAGIVAGTAIAGAREKGGPVWAGGTFLVGEKGPELFTPTRSGSILPNSAMGGGGGGGGINVTYAPVFNVDARSDRAQTMADMQGVAQRANADLVDRLQRAGRI